MCLWPTQSERPPVPDPGVGDDADDEAAEGEGSLNEDPEHGPVLHTHELQGQVEGHHEGAHVAHAGQESRGNRASSLDIKICIHVQNICQYIISLPE